MKTKDMLINSTHDLAQGVIIMTFLILLSALLRKIGLLDKKDSKLTGKLVLKVTLPAIIFSALAMHPIKLKFLEVSAIVTAVEIICLALAYVIARSLKFSRPKTGALMLVSAFGMSAMLGYPLIRDTFPGNGIALEYAVITSEIGVGLIIFIFGPIIATYFGQSAINKKSIFNSVYQFVKSPIFFALTLGIIFPYFEIPTDNFTAKTIGKILTIVGHSNQLLVAITIGLLLEIRNYKSHITFLLIAIFMKLILEPLLTFEITSVLNIELIARQVSFIETAMPSSIIIAIYAREYNCEPELVSTTTLITLLVSLISVAVFFGVLF